MSRMASMFSIKNFASSLILNNHIQFQQVRTKFADWRMVKDHRRRQTVKEYGEERFRINIIRKNNVLPYEIRAEADKEMAAFPRDASTSRLVCRCVLTSRPRGVVKYYRISRIMFRKFADSNQLPGVQRAFW